MLVFAVMMVVFLVIHKQKQNRNRLERQQLEHSYKSALLSSKIEVQEQALSFVSQEIHDNIGQMLSFSLLQLTPLKNAFLDENQKKIFGENLEGIRNSIKSLRHLSHNLNSTMVEQRDLEDAIKSELDRIKSFSKIHCAIQVKGEHEVMSPEHRLICFRIFQEALQNIVKHSEAKNVLISLNHSKENLELRIKDDGKGMDTKTLQHSTTMGMINMRQRAGLLQGSLQVHSGVGAGTEIVLFIPRNSA